MPVKILLFCKGEEMCMPCDQSLYGIYLEHFLGGKFLLTVGASLLTVELLCSQSAEVLIRHAFPL